MSLFQKELCQAQQHTQDLKLLCIHVRTKIKNGLSGYGTLIRGTKKPRPK